MYSDYTTTIKLEPFFQRFLLHYFNEEPGEVFRFPPKEDYNKLLLRSVTPPPRDYKPQDYGESTFRVQLPYCSYKDVAVYNYMSELKQKAFVNYTRRFMNYLFHDELKEVILDLGLTRMEGIDFIRERFGFLPEDSDRLIKEYQRWRNRVRVASYRKKIREGKMSS